MQAMLSLARRVRRRYATSNDQEQQPDEVTLVESLLPPPYHDNPVERPYDPLTPQQYVDPKTGMPRPLVVQTLHSSYTGPDQAFNAWKTRKASSNASMSLRLSAWVLSGVDRPSHVAIKVFACLAAVLKAIALSPVFAWLNCSSIEDPSARLGRRFNIMPIPGQYTEFRGHCDEYPKHARSALDAAPAPSSHDTISSTNNESSNENVKEQQRLFRPRKLFVKDGRSWRILDGDSPEAEKPYVFISYAANQFHREQDASGRLVLTDDSSKRLKQRAEEIVEENNLEAYWIDFLRAPEQPEATDDVHRFCDVVRGSEKVCVLLSEERDISQSLAMFGKRLWCLPECLLAPGHVIYVIGGGKSETVSIMQLPARAWTKSYTDDAGNVVEGKGKKEEFRLLAEHFSGLLTLSRLELFSVALSAMRALEFFPFQNGDMAYALMGLLRKRPSMDATDSEQQALARLCLSNDSDRIIERMACMLPIREVGSERWLGIADAFGANLWDIEPLCQVAGICNDEAIIIDGCHAAHVKWDSIPRIRFKSQKSRKQHLIAVMFQFAPFCTLFLVAPLFMAAFFKVVPYFIAIILGQSPHTEPFQVVDKRLMTLSYFALWPTLILGFLAPFCVPYVRGGDVTEIQPWLIGFQGMVPIEQLENMIFGNHAGRLQYTASSGLLCARDNTTRRGVAPVIDMDAIPTGHNIFTLVDTGSLEVTVFSALRPPTVALLCGNEGGMLRVVLCSYNQLTNALRKENVLRKEGHMWGRSGLCGWIKLAL